MILGVDRCVYAGSEFECARRVEVADGDDTMQAVACAVNATPLAESHKTLHLIAIKLIRIPRSTVNPHLIHLPKPTQTTSQVSIRGYLPSPASTYTLCIQNVSSSTAPAISSVFTGTIQVARPSGHSIVFRRAKYVISTE